MRLSAGSLVPALLLAGLAAVPARAFIKPVVHVVADVVENRKGGKSPIEYLMKHKIEVAAGQSTEIEERLLWDHGRVQLYFKFPGMPQAIVASADTRGYAFDYGKVWSRRSHVFYRALFATSTDDLLEPLLGEEFVRRDQMMQFKPGFQPTGDPKEWEVRDNYLRHDDVYLHRIGKSVTIAVAGANDKNKRRIVYFDRDRKQVRRLEWFDGQDTVAWNFETFLKSPPQGYAARHMSFEINNAERVSTEVVQIRALSDKQVAELRRTPHLGKGTVPPGNIEEVLGLLLSYR